MDSVLDGSQGVLLDDSSDSGLLVVSFGSMFPKTPRCPKPLFEFVSVLAEEDCKKLFLRDMYHAWYHRGVEGFSDSMRSTIDNLAELLDTIKHDKIIMIGSSSGGYAAMVCGCLCGVDIVHSFSGNAIINSPLFTRAAVYFPNLEGCNEQFFDVKPILAKRSGITEYHHHFGWKNPIDRRCGEYLKDIPNFHLHPYPVSGHAIAKHLNSIGTLSDIIMGRNDSDER